MTYRRNTKTGVLVNVDDATAAHLSPDWVEPSTAATAAAEVEEQTDRVEPRGNASREEWATYAGSLGVEFDDEAKRDDIRAAVEQARTAAAEVEEQVGAGDTPESTDTESSDTE